MLEKVDQERYNSNLSLSSHFKKSVFLDDISKEIEKCKCSQTHSDMNFSLWNALFLLVLNKHAPIKEKRVKRSNKSTCLNEEITTAEKNREFYHKKQIKIKNVVL